ncbi:MAG: GDP-mannose 4,6-dehydratase [Gemmatimonadales bacterium]
MLVTGAAGFLGSHVSEALLAHGDEVVGLDNFDPFYAKGVKQANLAGLLKTARFRFVEGDIRDRKLTRELITKDTLVVHLAARAGVRPSIADPELYVSVNVAGTNTLLEACRAANARGFVLAGSSSVYGDDAPAPFREDYPATAPISPYAATKRACELLAATYVHLFGMRIISLRFFTVYGARQRPDLAIHTFTRLIAAGQKVPMFGDGSSERDYTWVDDIVQGVLAACDWTAEQGPAFEIVNLGGSRTTRLDRLIALIGGALGKQPVIERRPMQPGDVRRTCADLSKARALLGYRPSTTVEDGIPRFVRWYEESHGRQA